MADKPRHHGVRWSQQTKAELTSSDDNPRIGGMFVHDELLVWGDGVQTRLLHHRGRVKFREVLVKVRGKRSSVCWCERSAWFRPRHDQAKKDGETSEAVSQESHRCTHKCNSDVESTPASLQQWRPCMHVYLDSIDVSVPPCDEILISPGSSRAGMPYLGNRAQQKGMRDIRQKRRVAMPMKNTKHTRRRPAARGRRGGGG